MPFPQKRSSQIRLILIGSIASGALSSCSKDPDHGLPAAQRVFPNDYHLEGAGYYHAPFRNWYIYPYNSVQQGPAGGTPMYFYGGRWGTTPHESIINVSTPDADGLRVLNRYERQGFGTRSGRHFSTHC